MLTVPSLPILTTCFCLRGLTQKVPSVCWNENKTAVTSGGGQSAPAVHCYFPSCACSGTPTVWNYRLPGLVKPFPLRKRK